MPRKVVVQIVEVDKEDLKPLGSIKETQAAILSLGEHLGFLEILRRLRVQRAMLQSRLNNPDEPIENVTSLRALLKAFSFCEQQLKLETARPQAPNPRDAYENERQAYEEVARALSLVGGQAN